MGSFPVRMCVHCMHTWWPQRPEDPLSSGIGVTDGYELAALWVLGVKLSSSGRSAGALNHWPISIVPEIHIFNTAYDIHLA